MGVYAAVAWRSFRRYATYRAATLAGVFTNTIFGFIIAFTYLALWSARPHLGGYDTEQALIYAWLGQSLMVTNAIFGGGFQDELAGRIRNGDVAIDLYRPVDLQAWWLSSDLGRAGLQLLARGVPPTLIGVPAFGLHLTTDPVRWAAFGVAMLLGLLVSFGIRYLVVLVGFWLLDARGVQQLAGVCGMFFSGMLLPLNVFPGALGQVAQLLPWSALLQVPADVLLGQYAGPAVLRALGFQAVWAAALLLGGRVLDRVATRKVVVQGG